MTVLSLVMVATLTVFLPSLGRFAVADTAYDAQRHAVAAVTMMATDLRDTRLSRLVWVNSAPDLKAVYVPTARDAAGVFKVTPETDLTDPDQPAWQGWVVYWTSDDPSAPGQLVRLHRGYVAGDVSGGAAPTVTVGGRVVASGLGFVQMLIGQNPELVTPRPGGITLGIDKTTSAWTPGGHGRVRVVVSTRRTLHDKVTAFQGEKIVDVQY